MVSVWLTATARGVLPKFKLDGERVTLAVATMAENSEVSLLTKLAAVMLGFMTTDGKVRVTVPATTAPNIELVALPDAFVPTMSCPMPAAPRGSGPKMLLL